VGLNTRRGTPIATPPQPAPHHSRHAIMND
jgi:hypothetical protein